MPIMTTKMKTMMTTWCCRAPMDAVTSLNPSLVRPTPPAGLISQYFVVIIEMIIMAMRMNSLKDFFQWFMRFNKLLLKHSTHSQLW